MKVTILAINTSLALIAGISIGLLISKNDSSESALISASGTTSNHSKNQIEPSSASLDVKRLENLLQEEEVSRQSLQSEVDELRQLIEALSENIKVQSLETSRTQTPQQLRTQTDRRMFDSQALVDIGMTQNEARELKNFYERQELERLQIRDQSIRESWDREQFRDAMQALQNNNADTLDNLNDDEYDAFLYATGQSNRVEVSSVLDSSQAQLAGMQAGDQILRYDGLRVYSWNELRSATSQGLLGEQVLVEVERDGAVIEYYLDRGPLGIRMNSISKKP